LQAYGEGALIAGSSAGAMVLCEHYFDPDRGKPMPGLNLLPNTCILPHHNTFGKGWAAQLAQRLPHSTLIGIDEQTGILNDPSGAWTIYGAGEVKLYWEGQAEVHARGETFSLTKGQAR
jgi:cyanophycinase